MQRHIRKSFLVIIFIFFAAAFSHTEIYGSIMDEYIQTPLFSYHDIKKVPWAENAIEVLSSYGIISGLPDGYFYPEAYITRAEYTKIIISAFGLYDDRANIQLSDSKPTDWHNKYIGSAVKHGIAQGVSWDYYGVDDYITREEMFVMTYNAIKAAKLSLPQYDKMPIFMDEDDISSYAKEAVLYLSSAQTISGYPSGKILPKNTPNRAEACTFIYNILKAVLEGEN